MIAKRISTWAIGLVLVALYVYATVAAVGNLIGMGAFLGDAFGVLPWVLLGVGVAVPAISLILALALAAQRGAWARILLLATGLCVTAAVQLEIMHLIS